MWNHLIKRWMDLAFWWLPGQRDNNRHEGAGPHAGSEGFREEDDSLARKPKSGAQPETPSQPAAPPKAATPPKPEPGAAPKPEPAPEAPQEPAPAAAASGPDDLTVIKGIGAAMQHRLNAHGIRSFADLAAADAEQLCEKLKADKAVISLSRVQEWIGEAGRRNAG